MASDSDEEDRLLQMALKEQEERDLTYQKPPRSTKPVVNLVQQPAARPTHRNAGSGANPSSRGGQAKPKGRARPPSRGGDDDDDSEVELLSISSGDEDSSKDRVGPVKGRTGGSDRRSSRDDGELGWDDDEPRSWKRVDEAELARRVREMRETRAAPGVDQKAVAMARKGLTSIASLPKGVEVLDPLGLGVIDNKTLRLITDSSSSMPASREKNDLDAASREKILYSSPNFDPKAFLARVHQETSAADLESGALTLKTDLKGRTQQKKQLVKENFDCFVSCKTTIDDIESKLRQIEEDPEGAGTAHLYEVTQKISSVANRAFQPLFERQAQADKIRSVQGMLQRFRTLFNLPSSIRGSIKKGEYDLAVREYSKAKSIVLPSHVGILKRVLEEVEKVMQEFRGMLYKSMEDPLLDLAELENIVRLLLELEPDSDPVWHYLNIQNRRIHGLFEKCTVDHEARMEALQNQIREKLQSDARWRQLQEDSNKSLDVDLSTVEAVQLDTYTTSLMAKEADELRASYIRRLRAVLLQHIPAFWRLALSVFSGKFAKSAGNVIHDAEANGNKTEEKSSEAKYSNHTLEEVASMVNSTLSVFHAKVLATFREFEESNILSPQMSETIKEIAKVCQSLEGKDSSPHSAVKILRGLHFEMTKVYIIRLCTWMRTTTREISSEEMWVTLSTLERNKSPYAISHMPLVFRKLIISSMDLIDLMLQNLRSETSKYDISEPLHEIQESVRLAFLNSFLDIAGYLEGLGCDLIAQSKSNRSSSNLQNSYLHGIDGDIASNGAGEGASETHRKLLIVLSNIGYCKEELSCDLYSKYKHIWSRDGDANDADMRDLTTSFSALEEKVLEQYTFAKSNVIRNAALKYLLDSGVQWGAAPAVKGIRDATMELLHILVAVHAEVYSAAKPLLEKTLTILVEGLIDTFLSLFHESKSKGLKSLDANGFCQLMLELDYFETVLNAYFSQEAHQALKSLQGNLLDKACESASDETPGHHRRPTRGSDDPMADDRSNPSVSADELLALAQHYSNELLEGELDKTKLNIACFIDSSVPMNYAPPPPQSASVVSAPVAPKPVYPSFKEGSVASPSFRRQQNPSLVGSPAVSRRRR